MNETGTTYLTFVGKIDRGSIETLLATCSDLCNHLVQDVWLLLSSSGGSVDDAIAAYNLLRGMPFHLTTQNIGTVESIANVLFLAGEKRYACPTSSFMFHGVGFNVSARTRFEMKSLRERIDSVEADQRKIADVLADRTNLSPEAIEELFLEAVTRDPQYAVDHGIVDGVRPVEIPSGARVRQLRFKH
jgi:ATP-dependent protease ClpP protease subunit